MNKQKRDLIIGFLTGLLAPLIGFYFYTHLVLKVPDMLHAYHRLIIAGVFTQTVALSMIANLLVLFVYNKRNETMKIRGLIGASVFLALLLSFWNIL